MVSPSFRCAACATPAEFTPAFRPNDLPSRSFPAEHLPMPRVSASPAMPLYARGAIAIALVCGAAFLSGCGSQEVTALKPETPPLPTIRTSVITLEPQPWPAVVRSQGSLVADEVAVIGAKVAGTIETVHVDLGDAVSAGDPLAALDQKQFVLEVKQAEAQLHQARSAIGLARDASVDQLDPKNAPPVRQEQAMWDEAKANLVRARQLQIDRTITRAELDAIVAAERVAEARYAAAVNSVLEKIALIGVREAELSLARERLEYTIMRAPFDGIVQQRHVAPGSYTPIGGSMVTVVRTNPLRFQGAMPERHAQRLAIGQQVKLKIESIDEPRTVQITRISPALDSLTRSLMFEAEVDNRDRQLRSGLFAEAEVLIDPQATALAAPHSAVIEFAGTEKVWKVVDGIATEQEVLTGERRPGGIEILRGLAAGDVIVQNAGEGKVAVVEPLDAPNASERSQESGELSGKESEEEKNAAPAPFVSG